VEISLEGADRDLGVAEPAQPDLDGRPPGRVVLRVGHDRGVRLDQLRVLVQELEQHLTPRLLLALDQEPDVDGRLAPLGDGLERLDDREELPLVVGRAARVEVAVTDRRLVRRRVPQLQRLGRLHVVVPVDHHGGLPRHVRALGVHHRVRLTPEHPDVAAAERLEVIRDPVGGPPALGGVVRRRGYAGDAEQLGQLRHHAIAIARDVGIDIVHDRDSPE
jgi:hypothetical protein